MLPQVDHFDPCTVAFLNVGCHVVFKSDLHLSTEASKTKAQGMAKDGFFWLHCLLVVLVLSINNILCSALDEDRKANIGPTLFCYDMSKTSIDSMLVNDR